MQKPKTRVLLNPLMEDFTCYWNKRGVKTKKFTIHAGEKQEFEEPMATHIKKHLANRVMDVNGIKRGNWELTLEEINEEIEIDI